MKNSYLFLSILWLSISISYAQSDYYVSTTGNDATGSGTINSPWATITHALDNAADSSTIWVLPGTYNGRVRIRGSFPHGVLVKSQIPYEAKLRHSGTVMTVYAHSSGCNGITFDGLDVAHDGPGAAALVVHIDGAGTGAVHDITYQNCILHDSYNNDIAKINNSCYNITIQGNLFFNQTGSDEHIDGNSVENLIIQDNIFMNDFASSGRQNANNTSSYIVIKDSNGSNDLYTGSRNVTIRRNVFLNYEGSAGHNFVLIGEDGNPYHEGFDMMIENNLLLGNSSNTMRAPFGIKGGRNITFRNNTIVGDMPGNAFAFRFNTEGSNPNNDSIYLYNNIWSDPTGSMNDFSDCPLTETDFFVLNNNLFWNANNSIPSNANDLINHTDDANAILMNPLLGGQNNLVLPYFNSNTNQFNDGSTTIRGAFERLVDNYGTPSAGSPAIDAANSNQAPSDDILGNTRTTPDIGAVEHSIVSNLRQNHWLQTSTASIFPNPASHNFTLKLSHISSGTIYLNLYHIDGHLIESRVLKNSTTNALVKWQTQELPQGIYHLQIKGTNLLLNKTLLIAR
ncbi:T9SS type A sorting domain-containing protein [Aureispira sp. CCB-QB1]|uniref:T9SS type A sorting domain-containing protein n=1 Tax=Aureispira sp. CCB-QB1 TaxID=1313421 RepID=UPI000696D4B9|nr:T9SS type A sorting domain-containing protein [Aureispira sp. CCB-QB1]